MFHHLLNKRSLIGSALFLVLAGEITVGYGSRLYTLPGCIALVVLYFLFFHLLDALVTRYSLSNLGVVLITFALYSMLVTGFLHQELITYVQHPEDWLITTCIRIQCSLFPLFAYRLLDKIAPRQKGQGISTRLAMVLFAGYIVILSPTRLFGIGNAAYVVRHAPAIGLVCIALFMATLVIGLRMKARTASAVSFPGLTVWSILLLAVALVPVLPALFVLLVMMTLVSVYYLAQPDFRQRTP